MKTARTSHPHGRSHPTRPARRGTVLRRSLFVLAALAFVGVGIGAPSAMAAAPSSCQPGSGVHLTEHRFTAAELAQRPDFRCADLHGASFAGLSLIQVDFTGADLSGAKLAAANLSQAEMTGADLTDADLQRAQLVQTTLDDATLQHADIGGANMSQAELRNAVLTDSDLSDTDLTQADLTDATLDGADLSGTVFTQAKLAGSSLQGATGVVRWDTYLAIGAVALLVLLTLGLGVSLRRHRLTGPALARAIAVGVIGRVVLVLGLHLLIGGLIGVYGTAFGGPFVQMCSGPQCAVGVDRGIYGPFIGVVVLIVGLLFMGSMRPRPAGPIPVPVPAPYQPLINR